MQNFKELKIWIKGMEVAKMTCQLTETLPKSEQYGWAAQMNRCAVSVPFNRAEEA